MKPRTYYFTLAIKGQGRGKDEALAEALAILWKSIINNTFDFRSSVVCYMIPGEEEGKNEGSALGGM